MLRMCKAWRHAIDADSSSLWREAAFAKYPRLNDILVIAGAQRRPPCFRSLYRSQVAVDRPTLQAPALDTYALTVELHADAGAARRLVARASDRLDRIMTEEGQDYWDGYYYARMVLTNEPAFDDFDLPTYASFGDFVRDRCYFSLYATRLSDLKTAKLVEVTRIVEDLDKGGPRMHPDRLAFGRHMHEGGERFIVYNFHELWRRTLPYDDGDGFNDQGMYAAFDPLQMVFYFDLWERSSNGPHPTLHYENEGASPEGDLALADEDLRQFLGSLALWK